MRLARGERRIHRAAALVAAAAAACLAGPRAPSGRVTVRIAAPATASADSVRLDVSPAGVSAVATPDGGGAFAAALTVLAGPQTFTATALRSGVAVGTGVAQATVLANEAVDVFIRVLSTADPGPSPDHGPVITAVAAPATLVAGAVASLSASAVDPDGDPIAFAWRDEGCGGVFGSPGAAATTWTRAAEGACVLTVTATANGRSDARSVSIAVVAPLAFDWWTEAGVGDFGYFDATPPVGLWDEAPGGRPDHLMLFQGGTPVDPVTGEGSSHLSVIHGPVGGPLATASVETSLPILYVAVAWDTVRWRIHAIAWVNRGPGTYQVDLLYVRLAPVRDAAGRISGFSREAEVLLDDLLGGVYATSLAELVDGAGNPRLGFVSVADTYVQPWAALRAFVTTPAAGVEPAALSDFAALDGAPGYTELYRFDWPAQGTSSMAAYGTSATLVQQRGSRRIQFLAATGLHGQGGPHYRVQATPSGTGWSVPAASEATSFNDLGTLGAFAVPGPDDSVWWIWDDGTDTRISRVNADGSVEWSPLPALGWRAPEPGNAHLSVRRGAVAVILHPGEWSETRARLFAGGAWHDWIPIAPAGFAYTHGGLAGFGQAGGRWWTAAATSQKQAGPPRITAVAFPAGTP